MLTAAHHGTHLRCSSHQLSVLSLACKDARIPLSKVEGPDIPPAAATGGMMGIRLLCKWCYSIKSQLRDRRRRGRFRDLDLRRGTFKSSPIGYKEPQRVRAPRFEVKFREGTVDSTTTGPKQNTTASPHRATPSDLYLNFTASRSLDKIHEQHWKERLRLRACLPPTEVQGRRGRVARPPAPFLRHPPSHGIPTTVHTAAATTTRFSRLRPVYSIQSAVRDRGLAAARFHSTILPR